MILNTRRLKPLLCMTTCLSLLMSAGCTDLTGVVNGALDNPGVTTVVIAAAGTALGHDAGDSLIAGVITEISLHLFRHVMEHERREATREEQERAREQAAARPPTGTQREAIRNKKVNLKYAEIIGETDKDEYLVIIIDPDTNEPVDEDVYIVPKREFDKLETGEADGSPKNTEGKRTTEGVETPPSKKGRSASQASDSAGAGSTGEEVPANAGRRGRSRARRRRGDPEVPGQYVPPIGPRGSAPGQAGPQPGATPPRKNETVPSAGSDPSAGENQSQGGDPGQTGSDTGQQEPGGQKGPDAGTDATGAEGQAGSGNQAESGSDASQAGDTTPPDLGGQTGSEPGTDSPEDVGQSDSSDPTGSNSDTSQPNPAGQSGNDAQVGSDDEANADGDASEEPERPKFGKLGAHNVIFRL